MDKLETFSALDKTDKWLQSWWTKITNDDPVIDLEEALPIWRNKIRFLYYNNPIAKAAIQNMANLTVGGGIFPNPLIDVGDPRKNHEIAQAIIKEYEDWSNEANIDGVTDLSSTLRQSISSFLRDGDVLVYLANEKNKDCFVLDLIDASRIETPKDTKSKNIKIGVEVVRRVIKKYWIKVSGEKSWTSLPVKNENSDLVSILLKNPYNSDIINSYRGIPILAPCLSTVEDLNSVLKDELRATKINRSKLGVLTTQGNVSDSMDAVAEEVIGNIGYQKHGDLEILVMQNGDKLDLHGASDVSNPQVTAITKLYLKQIASVFNVPYNALYSDIDDNTYSTNQSILLEGWRACEIFRKYLIQNLLKPLYRLNLERWILAGKIPHIKEYSDDIAQVQFNGRAINSVKAKDHIEGQIRAIEGNLKSVQMAALENGDNPWQIMKDKLEYEEELKYQQSQRNISINGEQDIRENEQIIKIVDMYNNEKLSYESAKVMLKDMYKYDEDEIRELLPIKQLSETYRRAGI